MADRHMARARLKRRGFPIHGYVGPNGTGKSAIMVYDTILSLEFGRPCLSTVRLLDYKNPRPCDDPLCSYPSHPDHQAAHPLYVPLTSYAQLLDARDCDVLMDEVTGVASSRESQGMPAPVANMLVQLRRRNVALRWSAPSWGRADKIIREVSQGVTLTSAAMPKKAPPTREGAPTLWHQRRLFTARTYDPVNMDEFEAHRADAIPHDVIAFYWGPGSTMFRAYDTLDSVTSLGWTSDAGTCLSCGGKRRHAPCSCDDHNAPAPRAGRAVAGRQPEPPGPGRHVSPAPVPAPVRLTADDLDPVAGR